MTNPVKIAIKNNIGWITIDNPPVNATSTAVRAGLLDAVDAVKHCQLAVLQCAGSSFVSGGDMSEFDAPPLEPHLPDVVDAVEKSQAPFLALLHGNVLGGGFEIAAACAFRVAKTGTKFGLPEVKVGLIPGAGGTQRAPRLLGWPIAFEMACLGQLKTAEDLLEVDALDAIVDDFDDVVDNFIGKQAKSISERTVEPPAPDILMHYRNKIERFAKGQRSPHLNFDALQWAVEPYVTGQAKERALHLELRHSDESRALRHIFFSERSVTKPALIRGIETSDVQKIGIIGGGLMGSGIAAACLMAGYEIFVIEKDASAASAAKEKILDILRGALERGKIKSSQFENYCKQLITGHDYQILSDVDLVIEAVFEDLAAKREVFAKLTQVVRATTILATNTSYLDPNDIFTDVENPERCVGIHFFSPAHIMKLVEVIQADHTSDQALATAFALAKVLRKMPVLSGVCDGFIGNRILSAYRRGAEYLVADGALPQEIDAAMRDFGMAMGPFEAQDMSGLQIAEANRRRQDATRNPKERYVTIADDLCARGRYGQRTGFGWYKYDAGSREPQVDDLIEDIIINYSAEQSIKRKEITGIEIQNLLLAVMANEGARIVEEGIAADDASIDVVKTSGYGFPRWKGGPMHWGKVIGAEKISEFMNAMMQMSPHSWVLAERFNRNQTI